MPVVLPRTRTAGGPDREVVHPGASHQVAVWLGAHDEPDSIRDSEHLAATIPRASFVIDPEAGHLLAIPHWRKMLLWLH
jgi:hypothetical protein